ncbi:hypothetical protein LCGC14_1071170 [marine sediment metagenome]|uniref:Uncharacterized protein n=1 Tax=marine sediment metagenome TaxID=412755 RepID=A0A0F9QP14_9ZZZZ
MNWYKKAQRIFILWHATIPDHAEEIIQDGVIQPSLTLEEKTGRNYSGWNFPMSGGRRYGEGVYLSPNKEEAISYAWMRMEREVWDNIEDIEELYNEEEYGFVAVFKIYFDREEVGKSGKLINLGNKEYMFLGDILKGDGLYPWYEGPEWIDGTKALAVYRERKNKIIGELEEGYKRRIELENMLKEVQQMEDSEGKRKRMDMINNRLNDLGKSTV